MMVNMVKNRLPEFVRVRAVAVTFFIGLMWTVHARADEVNPRIVTATAVERPARLSALTVGGVRDGQVMVITEQGTRYMKAALLAQRQPSEKLAQFADFCASR